MTTQPAQSESKSEKPLISTSCGHVSRREDAVGTPDANDGGDIKAV